MSEINLLILDFDGVLTDNKVYVFEGGRKATLQQSFNSPFWSAHC